MKDCGGKTKDENNLTRGALLLVFVLPRSSLLLAV